VVARAARGEAMALNGAPPRYDGVAQLLHWVTTAALFLMLPFVWVAENFSDGPTKVFWYLLHESFGICIFLLVIARVTWRFVRPPPAPTRTEARLLDAIARLNHWLLYAVLIVMPVTGYLMAGNGQPVPFFGVVALPGLPKDGPIGILADTIHVYAQFALYAAVFLHLAGTVWHVAVLRDGLLDRMLPPQRSRE
jgi:cytochrome b561